MLKSLAPVTTLVISWLAGLSNPSTSRWINVLVIAAGVLLSSIGEVKFGWRGFLFQIIGTVAESSRLILIQWCLTATVEEGQVTDEEEDLGLTNEDEELEHELEGAMNYANHEDLGTPTNGGTTQDGASGEDPRPQQNGPSHLPAEAQGIAGMSPLVLLFYYAPACMGLNLLAASWTEIPYFKMENLDRVGYGILVISGAVAFLLNVASVCLVCSFLNSLFPLDMTPPPSPFLVPGTG